MARCHECGYNLGPDATVCPMCGAEVSLSSKVDWAVGEARSRVLADHAEETRGRDADRRRDRSDRAYGNASSDDIPHPGKQKQGKKSNKVMAVVTVFMLLAVAVVLVVPLGGDDNTDGSLTHPVSWYYDDKKFSIVVDIPLEEYEYYSDNPTDRTSRSGASHIKDFVITTGVTADLADDLVDAFRERYTSYTQEDLANFILGFIQINIKYKTDAELYGDKCILVGGVPEYWAFPAETLFHMAGDCEDTSTLCAALLNLVGLRSSILYFRSTSAGLEGHVMAGVNLVPYTHIAQYPVCYDERGDVYVGAGTPYYGCETTVDYRLNVGDSVKGAGRTVGIYSNWSDTLVFTI